MGKKVAVIDIGSHSIKLEIFKISNNQISKIKKWNDYLYLFQDIKDNNTISDNSIKRLIKLIKKYKKIIDKYECDNYHIIATSALREATNSSEVVKEIYKKTNIEINIISGEEEANLSQKAFLHLSFKDKEAVLFDLGGGSTEVSLFINNEVKYYHSFEIGVIRCVDGSDLEKFNELSNKLKENINTNKKIICYGIGSSIRRFAKMIKLRKRKLGYKIFIDDVLNFKEVFEKNSQEYIESNYDLNGLKYPFLKVIIDLLLTFYLSLNTKYIQQLPISIRYGYIVKNYLQ